MALRPATSGDTDFLRSVYASTREYELAPLPWTPEQKAAFIAQQFAAQSAHYAKHYAGATTDVVLVDGEPAGRLMVMRREHEILIVDIALLPQHRSRGVGSRLIAALMEEADERDTKLSIHVERENPALRLYERLGFEHVGNEGVYLTMQRPPSARDARTES